LGRHRRVWEGVRKEEGKKGHLGNPAADLGIEQTDPSNYSWMILTFDVGELPHLSGGKEIRRCKRLRNEPRRKEGGGGKRKW